MPVIGSTAFPSAAGPVDDGFAVTPDDATDLPQAASGLYVGGAGNISLVTAKGTTLTLAGLPAGSWVPMGCKRVRSTGTTATNIVGLV